MSRIGLAVLAASLVCSLTGRAVAQKKLTDHLPHLQPAARTWFKRG